MNFLSNLFGGGNQESKRDADAPSTIFSVPAKNIKIGALRFVLQITMVSAGKKGTWFADQNEEGGINMYYDDGSAMSTIRITEYNIEALRYGRRPTKDYLQQESILLHKVLDELEKAAFDTSQDIEDDQRLIQLTSEDGIERAREKLPPKEEPTEM